MSKQYAVFDVDGTITRTGLFQLFVRELVARELLAPAAGREIELMLHAYHQRADEQKRAEYIHPIVERLLSSLQKSLNNQEYGEIVDAVTKSALQNTFVYTRELITTLKKNGFFLIALSEAETQLVAKLSSALGFNAWAGETTFTADKKGNFTGQSQNVAQTKVEILQAVVHKFGLEKRGSTAVGDMAADIAVLESVESPIVFNPSQELFKVAREKNWMIVIERKDMVYGLVKEGNTYVLKSVNA